MSDRMKISVFKPVSEDWHGNFRIADDKRHLDTKLVEVMVFEELDGSGFRVAVWGNDDMGMEKSFTTAEGALGMFHRIVGMVDMTQKRLTGVGFIGA